MTYLLEQLERQREAAEAAQPDESFKWPWLQTYTGKPFVPAAPDPELIDIRDIAIGLSRESRFNGHTQGEYLYSVAQHSVYASRVVPEKMALWGLLHDASEAYCKDLTWSIKTLLPEYKELEIGILKAVAVKFDLPWPPPPEIKEADNRLLATEKRDLYPTEAKPWREMPDAYDFEIKAWDHLTACSVFLLTFNIITNQEVPLRPRLWTD